MILNAYAYHSMFSDIAATQPEVWFSNWLSRDAHLLFQCRACMSTFTSSCFAGKYNRLRNLFFAKFRKVYWHTTSHHICKSSFVGLCCAYMNENDWAWAYSFNLEDGKFSASVIVDSGMFVVSCFQLYYAWYILIFGETILKE